MCLAASVVGCRFASNPIDIEENTAGHLVAAESLPQDGFFPQMQLIPNPHPMTDAGRVVLGVVEEGFSLSSTLIHQTYHSPGIS